MGVLKLWGRIRNTIKSNVIVHGLHLPISVHKISHCKRHIEVENIIDAIFFSPGEKNRKRYGYIKKAIWFVLLQEKQCVNIFSTWKKWNHMFTTFEQLIHIFRVNP